MAFHLSSTVFCFPQRLSAFLNCFPIFLNGFPLSEKSKKIYLRRQVSKRLLFELCISRHLLPELCNSCYNVYISPNNIDVQSVFLRELKEACVLVIKRMAGAVNETDIFTKNLDGPVFQQYTSVFTGGTEDNGV
jgi:hypothetical protein